MKFREDINGLRAIAVIAVVLFHFNDQWLPGGFIGVDIFFVISGFLMTRIIFTGLEQGSFSTFRFYQARAKRIIPPLVILCLILLVFGWFYLMPKDYQTLSKHALSSIFFISNFIYWGELGYFEAASHEKWLLHTWSLSAEWQFYLLYPLFLLTLNKLFELRRIRTILFLFTILGFIYCVLITIKWPDAAYFLLPTRAWEMMIGGVAFLYPFCLKRKSKALFEFAGVLFIALSVFLINQDSLWPGYMSLCPIIGTFFIIQAQRKDSVITGNMVFQKIGFWSYSIYLWHWPIVVYLYVNGFDSVQSKVLGITLSVFLGWLSFTTIESKFSIIANVNLVRVKGFMFFSLTVFFSVYVYVSEGSLSRFSDIKGFSDVYLSMGKEKQYYKKNYNRNYSNPSENMDVLFTCSHDENIALEHLIDCVNKKLGDEGFLIIGDSHGRDFLHSIKFAYPTKNFAMLHASSCAPAWYEDKCFPYMDEFITYINNNVKVKGVIFASKFIDQIGTNTFFSNIRDNLYQNTNIFIVGPGPIIKGKVDSYVLNGGEIQNSYYIEKHKMNQTIADLAESQNIKYLDIYDVFCFKEQCKLHDLDHNVFFFDEEHLSKYGIEYLGTTLRKEAFLND